MPRREHYSIDLVKKYENFLISPMQDWVAGRPYAPEVEKQMWEKFFHPMRGLCDVALINYFRARKKGILQNTQRPDRCFDLKKIRKFSFLKDGIWFLRKDFFENNEDCRFLMNGIGCKEWLKGEWRHFSLACCFLHKIEDFPLDVLLELIKIDAGHFFPSACNNFFSGNVGRGYKNIFSKLADDVVMISWQDDFRSITFNGKGARFVAFFENVLFEAIDRGIIDAA